MNIPQNDPGLVMVPGAVSWSEWNVRLAGGIATCVEVSEMVVSHIVKAGFPLSDAEDIALASDLITRGLASPNGATNWAAASEQMRRNGIPNQAWGPDAFPSGFAQICMDAMRRGIPVLFGVYAAHNLFDDWTQTHTDAGVDGHALALVGYDSTGAIAADPNTVQATHGDFVHYSWATLVGAEGGSPSMVIPLGRLTMGVTPTWDSANGLLKYPAHGGIPAITLEHGQAWYARPDAHARDGVYPLEGEYWEPTTGDGCVLWNDGIRTRAIKAQNWTIMLEDAGPQLAAALVAASQPATPPYPDLRGQLADVTSRLNAAQSKISAAQHDLA